MVYLPPPAFDFSRQDDPEYVAQYGAMLDAERARCLKRIRAERQGLWITLGIVAVLILLVVLELRHQWS